MPWTSDDFVAAVRRGAQLPDAGDVTSADILALGDDELTTGLTTTLKTAREEFWVKVEDRPLTTSRRYRLPRRAALRGLRAVSLVDSAGNESPFTGTDATTAALGTVGGAHVNAAGFAQRGPNYYIEDDFLVCLSDPPVGLSLRFRYLRRPSRLVLTTACAAISSAVDTTHLLCTTTPLTAAAQYVDIVRGDAPFDLSYTDLGLKGLVGSTYELSGATPIVVADFVNIASIPNDRQDYICPRDQTCYPPLPIELHPVLVAATVRRVLEDIGDRPGAALAEQTLTKRVNGAVDALQPRVQTEAKRLLNRNAFGGLGSRRR